MKQPHLSVIIPAYNEALSVKNNALGKVFNYLKKQKYTYEVLIVDDGSTDKTVSLVKKEIRSKKNFSLLEEPHRGKAGTVIAGMLAAKGEIILFTDMDQSTPLNQVEKLFSEFEKGADIVIGSRSGRKGAPLVRKIMAFGFASLRTIVLRLPFKDTQVGFKAFTHEAAQKVFTVQKKHVEGNIAQGASVTAGFDIEFLYIARKMGLKIKEVPVQWHYEPGASGKSIIKNSLDGLKGIFSVRLNALMGKYEI